MLHNSNAVEIAMAQIRQIVKQRALIRAAYPEWGSSQITRLSDKLRLAAEIDQVICVFQTQHWQELKLGNSNSDLKLSLDLTNTTVETAIANLIALPHGSYSRLIVRDKPNNKIAISSNGHGHHLDSEFLLARLFCPEQLAYWNAVSLPITLDKLVRLQTITNQGITTILGADRTALDLILNQNART
jgi:hypothetical protein